MRIVLDNKKGMCQNIPSIGEILSRVMVSGVDLGGNSTIPEAKAGYYDTNDDLVP